MINKELQNELKKFDDNKEVVFFSNGFKGKIETTEFDGYLIISGKGNVYPSPKDAIEGKEVENCNPSYTTDDGDYDGCCGECCCNRKNKYGENV